MKNIYDSGELSEAETCAIFAQVQNKFHWGVVGEDAQQRIENITKEFTGEKNNCKEKRIDNQRFRIFFFAGFFAKM